MSKTSAVPRIDLYFDYLSPYAYLGFIKLTERAKKQNWEINFCPVVFGALLDYWGQLGPAEIPPKREFVMRDSFRQAKALGRNLVGPKTHPFNPITALRLSLSEVSGERQSEVIRAFFEAAWEKDSDLGSKETLGQILNSLGLPGNALLEKTTQESIKEKLKATTAEAINHGVFGIPTFGLGKELFWGADQLDFLEAFIEGRDTLDEKIYREFISRPRAIDRKR